MVLAEPPETPPFIDTEIKLKQIYIFFSVLQKKSAEPLNSSTLSHFSELLRSALPPFLSSLFIGKCCYYLHQKCQYFGLILLSFRLEYSEKGGIWVHTRDCTARGHVARSGWLAEFAGHVSRFYWTRSGYSGGSRELGCSGSSEVWKVADNSPRVALRLAAVSARGRARGRGWQARSVRGWLRALWTVRSRDPTADVLPNFGAWLGGSAPARLGSAMARQIWIVDFTRSNG